MPQLTTDTRDLFTTPFNEVSDARSGRAARFLYGAAMAGDAYDTMQRFWDVQDAGDYTATVALFADDAVLVDPKYGTFEGREAIAGFMAKMNEAVGSIDARFELLELAGGETSAWARWVMISTRGRQEGVGIYRVKDAKLTFYRDYIDPM